MNLHSKYTDYKIIYKDEKFEELEHIKDSNRTISIYYYASGHIEKEVCHLNGKRHCENGPAYTAYYESGQIQYEYWYLNDKLHRENEPAYIAYYELSKVQFEGYFVEGKWHREDGPTKLWYNKSDKITSQEFYLNDIEYTYDDFIKTPKYQASLKQQLQDIFD